MAYLIPQREALVAAYEKRARAMNRACAHTPRSAARGFWLKEARFHNREVVRVLRDIRQSN